MATNKRIRVERDSMGTMEVPEEAYYGASTMRAVLNFPISNLRWSRGFVASLGLIKETAAEVNVELGLLDRDIGEAISNAAHQVVVGDLDDQFVLDVFQTGSGTSTNMNANEVIANRSTELLGKKRGSKLVHPNDHVNMGQSSNDVIPTAIHLAGLTALKSELLPALEDLGEALEIKVKEFWPVIKTGRTHLQDATPIRMGQEFSGFVGQVKRSIRRLEHAVEELSEVALGGTAVGTGVNTHPKFSRMVCERLSRAVSGNVHETENHFQSQSTMDAVIEASGSLRTAAISLHEIANNISWMGSGPRAGIGELDIPEVQPGSSIMPGKVNPVIPESLIQVVSHVLGNDLTISLSGQRSYFELNTMMPVAGYNFLESINILATATSNFTLQCVDGLKATNKGPKMVEQGLAICTALAPIIGYDAAADVAKEAARTGRTVKSIAVETTSLSEQELEEILDPAKMTEPGLGSGPTSG